MALATFASDLEAESLGGSAGPVRGPLTLARSGRLRYARVEVDVSPASGGSAEMNTPQFRMRVAVLWVAVAVAAASSLLLYLVVPGAVAEMVAGEMEGEAMTDAAPFMFAALVGIPLVMAMMTVLTGDRPSRYADAVVAVLVGLFAVYAVGGHLAAGDYDGHVAMAALAGVLAFVTAGVSIAWLRHPESTTPPAPAKASKSHAGAAV